MKKNYTKKEFEIAEAKMEELLNIVTIKGGFDKLTEEQKAALTNYTQIVKEYEEASISF